MAPIPGDDRPADGVPRPASPRRARHRVQPVKKLDLQAGVLRREVLDAQAAFTARTTHLCPSDQALCTGGLAFKVLEKSSAQSINRTEEGGGKLHGTHGKRRQGVEDCVQQDDSATRREKQRAPSGQVLVNLGDHGHEVCHFEFFTGEGESEIRLWETDDTQV